MPLVKTVEEPGVCPDKDADDVSSQNACGDQRRRADLVMPSLKSLNKLPRPLAGALERMRTPEQFAGGNHETHPIKTKQPPTPIEIISTPSDGRTIRAKLKPIE